MPPHPPFPVGVVVPIQPSLHPCMHQPSRFKFSFVDDELVDDDGYFIYGNDEKNVPVPTMKPISMLSPLWFFDQ
jgi:hypothetical protein